MDRLRILIENIVRECLYEGRFTYGPNPFNSRSHRERNIQNPIISHGNGNHSNADVVSQVATVDHNGANFVGKKHILLNNDEFISYKMNSFGNDRIKSTKDFFGEGARGEIELRREIDRLNGAARRNGRGLIYRTITSQENANISKRSGHMINTFWEFSLDDGKSWYVLKPHAVDNMKKSSLGV